MQFRCLCIVPVLNEQSTLQSYLLHCATLKKTFKDKFEFLFVDGGSSDDTVSILSASEFRFVIMPGSSIYEAYNLGVYVISQSDFTHFMFVGVSDKFNFSIDGSIFLHINHNTFFFSDFAWFSCRDLWKIHPAVFNIQSSLMHFPHAGSIFPVNLFKHKYYDIKYKICSDLDFVLRNKKSFLEASPYHFRRPFVILKDGGISVSKSSSSVYIDEYLKVCWYNRVIPSWKVIVRRMQ